MTSVAAAVLALLARREWTIATAESLTAGMVSSELAAVPGASAHLRGGVVAYATDVKRTLLGVDGALLRRRGAVDAEVARQMAAGARRLLTADVGVATTGVAGPDAQDGTPVGTVFVAVATPEGSHVVDLRLAGSRHEIRTASTLRALEAVVAHLS
ncbi:nicotinamide-nucleotide amidohydrolase family protein [Microbacterium sp. ARD31]|uniref:CinA family protein n=1 Tax=Microbacterium sp. ARD31 TaxID=2962576 RepID=UPI002882C835|nr:nicotinamide-nucleotide amidohydrolase family protein [Microbacterium sp. ARD31]MDT0186249.1 nicotinamide-nucleotide amidohydrolase family protein [Microbacterium sp. ARD31]